MAQEDKLDKVNATLDRFAKLIEENAQQLRKDKEEAKRQRAEDLAEAKRQRAEDLAKEKKRRAEDLAEAKRQRAEDLAKEKKRQAKEQKRKAKEQKRKAKEQKRKAEELAEEKKRQAELERQRTENEARWEKRLASFNSRLGGQGNSIGEITEALTVSDNIIDLINEFEGIYVEHFYFNVTKKYPAKNSKGEDIRKQYEVDGLASGETEVVVIEAKTVLTEERVQRFLIKLAKFKLAYPDHANKDLYGAITFIRVEDEAFALAKQHGLFLIKASPPDVELANGKGFKPTKII